MVAMDKSLSGALNTTIHGSGDTTLVLAHGYGGDQSIWDKLVPHLSLRYRVIVFDWCFSGAIDNTSLFAYDVKKHSSLEAFSEDFIDLADELGLKDIVYVGHSMAAMIGCIASIRRPDIFHHLILVGASTRYLNSEDYEGGFDMEAVENLFTNIETNYDQWTQGFAALTIGTNDLASTDMFAKMLQKMGQKVALALARTIFLCDHRPTLEKIEIPCSIIQTSNDIVVPMAVADYMRANMKGKVSCEVIDTDGHFPMLTVPQRLIDVIEGIVECCE